MTRGILLFYDITWVTGLENGFIQSFHELLSDTFLSSTTARERQRRTRVRVYIENIVNCICSLSVVSVLSLEIPVRKLLESIHRISCDGGHQHRVDNRDVKKHTFGPLDRQTQGC